MLILLTGFVFPSRAFHHWRMHYCSDCSNGLSHDARLVFPRSCNNQAILLGQRTDTPDKARPSILYSSKQLEIGRRRMEEIGRKPAAPFTKEKVSFVVLKTTQKHHLMRTLVQFRSWDFSRHGTSTHWYPVRSKVRLIARYNWSNWRAVYVVVRLNRTPKGSIIQFVMRSVWECLWTCGFDDILAQISGQVQRGGN